MSRSASGDSVMQLQSNLIGTNETGMTGDFAPSCPISPFRCEKHVFGELVGIDDHKREVQGEGLARVIEPVTSK